ncbi:MAG: 2-oxoacid:acceptor oxidoreductase family protein, partial [Porticoccaceae bacterium]|nr:2-oxoacid:acceptor oxidoreductase family protein [Porticoccaceae bacterium]
QGLPTWYEVRVSEQGYLGRRGGTDFMVSVNPQSMAKDIAEVRSGGYFLYDNTKPLDLRMMRDDITFFGIPLMKICMEEYQDARQRQLFKNMIYVGALAALLDIEFDVLTGLIADQFKGKEKLIVPNVHALELGFQYAQANFPCPCGLRLERRDNVGDKILLDGNTACGLGAVYGGATVAGWYPITPSTSVIEGFEIRDGRVEQVLMQPQQQPSQHWQQQWHHVLEDLSGFEDPFFGFNEFSAQQS